MWKNRIGGGSVGWLSGLAVAATVFIGLHGPAASTEIGPVVVDMAGPRPPITAYNGSYTYNVPIVVPAFRGLEPKLSLSYDSARGVRNMAGRGAWLGVGWQLDGISIIERVSGSSSPAAQSGGRGSPSNDASGFPLDNYILDGAELILCSSVATQTSTPSCSLSAGSGKVKYAARIENFLRIRAIGTATATATSYDAWEITAKDGTLYEYTKRVTDLPQFRWYLSKVTDRNGNHIDYTYSCEAGKDCVPLDIKYFNDGATTPIATITFAASNCPEVLTAATGNSVIRNRKVLDRISVNMSGLVRRYELTYETSTATDLSRLLSVQQFGSDSTTAHPETKFTYSNSPSDGLWSDVAWTGGGGNPSLTADFNGDGRTDYCVLTTYRVEYDLLTRSDVLRTTTGNTFLSSGEGFTATGYACAEEGYIGPQQANPDRMYRIHMVGDFDGDGADDILTWSANDEWECSGGSGAGGHQVCEYDRSPITIQVRKFVGSAQTIPSIQISTSDRSEHMVTAIGDFDGDGRADFITQYGTVYLSKTSGFVMADWGLSSGGGTNTGDFNGDGKIDLLNVYKEGSDWFGRIRLSTGTSFAPQPPVKISVYSNETNWNILVGDVNGDGRSDLVRVHNYGAQDFYTGGVYGVAVFISNGKTLIPAPEVKIDGFANTTDATERLADINGDGRSDLLLSDQDHEVNGVYFYSYKAFRSTGDGFTYVGGDNIPHHRATGDFDGDGRTDFFAPDGAGGRMFRSNGDVPPDLLTSITEPLGGKVTVTYTPSTTTTDTRLPYVLPVVDTITANDGRSAVSVISYDYEKGEWSFPEREFVGFRNVTTQWPAIAGEGTTGPTDVTTFHQSMQCQGAVTVIRRKNTAGTLLRKTTHSYPNDIAAPFTCFRTSTQVDDTVGATTKSTRTRQSYNLYRLVTQTNNDGDTRRYAPTTARTRSPMPQYRKLHHLSAQHYALCRLDRHRDAPSA